jgi:hypothetical protein
MRRAIIPQNEKGFSIPFCIDFDIAIPGIRQCPRSDVIP